VECPDPNGCLQISGARTDGLSQIVEQGALASDIDGRADCGAMLPTAETAALRRGLSRDDLGNPACSISADPSRRCRLQHALYGLLRGCKSAVPTPDNLLVRVARAYSASSSFVLHHADQPPLLNVPAWDQDQTPSTQTSSLLDTGVLRGPELASFPLLRAPLGTLVSTDRSGLVFWDSSTPGDLVYLGSLTLIPPLAGKEPLRSTESCRDVWVHPREEPLSAGLALAAWTRSEADSIDHYARTKGAPLWLRHFDSDDELTIPLDAERSRSHSGNLYYPPETSRAKAPAVRRPPRQRLLVTCVP
jgi:hypothetical protein